MNLLEETIKVMAKNNKTIKDVVWVGTREGRTSWQEFEKLANKTYYSGYGGENVNLDLLVVGKGWWLERQEYDGSEWWEFKAFPAMPRKKRFSWRGDRFAQGETFYIFYG
jgi:hypothetical protein